MSAGFGGAWKPPLATKTPRLNWKGTSSGWIPEHLFQLVWGASRLSPDPAAATTTSFCTTPAVSPLFNDPPHLPSPTGLHTHNQHIALPAPACPYQHPRWGEGWADWRSGRPRVRMASAPGSSDPAQISCAGSWSMSSTWAWSWWEYHRYGRPPAWYQC